MGKKDKNLQEELLKTLGDFTSKENWDNFFTIRGSDDSFEWYAEWPQLRDQLLSHLSDANQTSSSLRILIPGCGNSRLSEHLYDAGFSGITNIDFSKVVISDMLRRNVRSRPGMKWRVMDMTSMQFEDEMFDVVIDKGGLDALMEPELGPKLGDQYLSEVKRVLKSGGKFICLTLAESHVLGLLFPKLRFGWKMTLHAITQNPADKPGLHTFMMIAEKEKSAVVHQISSTITHYSLDCYGNQARGLHEALESENQRRTEYSNGSDILYSLEDLQLGAKGDLTQLSPGQRFKLTLGQQGLSRFCYRAVLLDAQQQSDAFLYHCGVIIVPKGRSHEWLFSSEEGQWIVVESSKAARLIMVLLDAIHSNASMEDIQKDLSPLVKHLAPGGDDSTAQIPFMAASDGIKQREIVHQVTSPLTGPIIVEDVVYEKADGDFSSSLPKDSIFRRLTFQRMEGLVQSEALVTKGGSLKSLGGTKQKKAHLASKSRNKGNQRRDDSKMSTNLNGYLKVDHNYLASSYHAGIIAGFMLISSRLESASLTGSMVKTVVIGLGAGLLPMFLHACLPILSIEVLELDPVVLDIARNYFDFKEDKDLKVHIADGIQFVRGFAKSKANNEDVLSYENDDDLCKTVTLSSAGSHTLSNPEGKERDKIAVLIIDVDSSDSSSGLTCPASDFVEDSFLSTVKDSLTEEGLFVINLVSRSQAIREMVVSRMKKVFDNIFHLQLEEDVNEVLYALNMTLPDEENCLQEASSRLEKLLKLEHTERSQNIIDATKKIKFVK
ncbi:Endothelin-converting enzyme 1 [Bertholletia excelsa]